MMLSLCMIVKNEEATLPHCLKSVQGVVDEMIVLDTGSSDRTPEIAKSFGAKVHSFEWSNDFSAARNESLKYVQGDWILVLDADERLAPGIVPALRQTIGSEQPYLLISLVRQEIGAEQSPYSLVSRLFRNHPDISFVRPYHAMVDESVSLIQSVEPHWQVGYLPEVAILHEGYQAGAIASRDKFTKARTAMEGFLKHHPSDLYVCSKLGALYVQMNEVPQGIELLKRGLTSKAADASVLYELHYHLGIAYSRLQQWAKAEQHYQVALQQSIMPKLKLGAYNNLGNLLKAKGDLVGAKGVYEATLKIDSTFAPGYYNLGMTLKALGDLPHAIAAYREALFLQPNYADAHQNLGVVLWKLGQVQESLTAFRQAIALHQQNNNPLEAQRLRQGLKEMGFEL
ncbi:tetratricopeptide repeat protein [Trichocoleus sp. FACHB-591]|nr:tetratricopeptide repeat protein [Trichocoleus sp. FACHB-591]